MPRYYFHVFNDETALDDEGQEFPDNERALQEGIASARALAADSVSKGHLDLRHRIDVVDHKGVTISSVYFRDVVKVEGYAKTGGPFPTLDRP